MRTSLSLLAVCCLFLSSFTKISAQETELEAAQRICGPNGNAIYEMMLQYPEAIEKVPSLRDQITTEIERSGGDRNGNTVLTIPVVFHVIHNGEPVGVGSNIPDGTIQSQIDILNECLRKMNADVGNVRPQFLNSVADVGIEVCLAQIDPTGVPTSGITRVQGGQATFAIGLENQLFMPANQWDPTKYLNIYSVTGTPGMGAVASGTPPGFPQAVDGIVLDFRCMGRGGFNFGAGFNMGLNQLGRVAVHEMGHYLGLMHLDGFGNGAMNGCTGETPQTCMVVGDRCCDTPDQPQISFTCTWQEFMCGSVNQVENFMQANNDGCKRMFTNDQTNIMRTTLQQQRGGLLNGNQCNRTYRAVAITPVAATLQWSGTLGAVSYNVQWNVIGMPFGSMGAANTGGPVHQMPIGGLFPNGAYGWQVQAVFANGNLGPWEPPLGATFRTPALAPAVVCPFDPNEGAIFGPYIQQGTNNNAYGIICPALDIDRFVLMDPMPERSRLYIQLTNVTADYDMDLTDLNGNILAQATTNGIVNELIIYDTPQPFQNYYVFVYAKPGQPVTGLPYTVAYNQIPLSANPPRLSDPDLVGRFNLYPNPATDAFKIEYYSEKEEAATLEIFDIAGRSIHSESMGSAEGLRIVSVDVSDLPQGMYICAVQTPSGVKTKKLQIN